MLFKQFAHLLLQFPTVKDIESVIMTDTTQPVLDPLAPRIEEFLLLSGMSQSHFGYVHFGDPAFILKMRRGRQFRRLMAEKIESVLKGEK